MGYPYFKKLPNSGGLPWEMMSDRKLFDSQSPNYDYITICKIMDRRLFRMIMDLALLSSRSGILRIQRTQPAVEVNSRPYNFIHLPWKQLAVVNFVTPEACDSCYRVMKCLAGHGRGSVRCQLVALTLSPNSSPGEPWNKHIRNALILG